MTGNESENSSSWLRQYPGDEDGSGEAVYREIVDIFERVVPPIVIGIGLAGNAVGTSSLRVAGLYCRGFGHLLVAICVSDAIFLASLLPMWLGSRYGRRYDLFNSDGWCELLSLTTMSSNFLSTWFGAALAVERHLAVRRSSRHAPAADDREEASTRTFCGPTRTRVAIVALTVLAIVVYVNMVVNIGVVGDGGAPRCQPLSPAVDAMRVLSYVDLVINVITPNFVIVALYAAIGVRLAGWRCRRRRAISRLAPPLVGSDDDQDVSPTEVRLIRTAFLLQAVVMLLSAPSHGMRVAYAVAEVFRLPVPAHDGVAGTLQPVAHQMFYASFAVPFFVVVASHSRIRRSVVLSLQLTVQSTWKRWYSSCCGCPSCRSAQTSAAELQLDSTVVTSETNR